MRTPTRIKGSEVTSFLPKDPLSTARGEFQEELGSSSSGEPIWLGTVTQKAGRIVQAVFEASPMGGATKLMESARPLNEHATRSEDNLFEDWQEIWT